MAKQPVSAPWYSGGTLHAARASEWRRATEPNRLATAADWAAKLVGDDLSCMEALRPYAEALKRCADAGVADPVTDTSMDQIAAACCLLMFD